MAGVAPQATRLARGRPAVDDTPGHGGRRGPERRHLGCHGRAHGRARRNARLGVRHEGDHALRRGGHRGRRRGRRRSVRGPPRQQHLRHHGGPPLSYDAAGGHHRQDLAGNPGQRQGALARARLWRRGRERADADARACGALPGPEPQVVPAGGQGVAEGLGREALAAGRRRRLHVLGTLVRRGKHLLRAGEAAGQPPRGERDLHLLPIEGAVLVDEVGEHEEERGLALTNTITTIIVAIITNIVITIIVTIMMILIE